MYKIEIVEDEALLRSFLVEAISKDPDFEVVAEVDDAIHALKACQKFKPDLILMDIKTPQYSGIDATADIKAKFPNVKILILSVLQGDNIIMDALKAGADGYILKSIGIGEIIKIIKDTLKGEQKEIYGNYKKAVFSDFEIKILNCLLEGCSSNEIAERLYYAHGTIRNYISSMLTRFNFKNQIQLVTFALKEGYISN